MPVGTDTNGRKSFVLRALEQALGAQVLLTLESTDWTALGDRATTAVPLCCRRAQPQWQPTKVSAIYTGSSCLLRLQRQTKWRAISKKHLLYQQCA